MAKVAIALTLGLLHSSEWIPPGWQEGGITFYYGDVFEGQPLYCGGVYAKETGPWLALDVGKYESGQARCGDQFLVEFADGSTMIAVARDAGHLADYTIFDSGLPFVADLPRYWRNGRPTATGRILNLSAALRAAQQAGMRMK